MSCVQYYQVGLGASIAQDRGRDCSNARNAHGFRTGVGGKELTGGRYFAALTTVGTVKWSAAESPTAAGYARNENSENDWPNVRRRTALIK